MLEILLPKLHKEGQKFVVISLLITFVLVFVSKFLGLISLVITIWIFYFFRDPERFPINDNSYLVSPADGVICQIIKTQGPKELSLDNINFLRVSVFMNVFNCHVNRVPVDSTVKDTFYKSGKFVNASLDEASTDNERNLISLNTLDGEIIILTQIAGLVARRIVSYAKKDQNYKQGESFGIIRFGSRVDIYFSENYKVLVKHGQTVVGGESLIAQKI